MKIEEAKKILVIRFSSLGDVLLTTPLLRILKNKYPNILIDYFIKSSFIDAIKLNKNLNKIYAWGSEKEFSECISNLKDVNYDFVIDLQNNLRSKKTVKSLGVENFKYIKPNLDKFLLVHFKINRMKNIKSIPSRYVESVPGLELDAKGLELFLPDDYRPEIPDTKRSIGFAPGAFHFTKRWPIEYFAELGNFLKKNGFQIVIFGGSSDKEICGKLSKLIPYAFNLCNENNLFHTAVNMKKCELVVCNDSGLMHTATAVSVPVVSIFGSTVKEFGFSPFGVKSIIVENENLQCRPCSHIGRAKCKKGHFKCMMDIKPESVLNSVNELLRNK